MSDVRWLPDGSGLRARAGTTAGRATSSPDGASIAYAVEDGDTVRVVGSGPSGDGR